jgi:hypothetical protein
MESERVLTSRWITVNWPNTIKIDGGIIRSNARANSYAEYPRGSVFLVPFEWILRFDRHEAVVECWKWDEATLDPSPGRGKLVKRMQHNFATGSMRKNVRVSECRRSKGIATYIYYIYLFYLLEWCWRRRFQPANTRWLIGSNGCRVFTCSTVSVRIG